MRLLAVLCVVLWGCGHSTVKANDVVTTIAQAGTCLASDYDEISNAILGGGSNWFSIIAELLPCVGKVVTDLFATVNEAKTAQATGAVTPPEYNGKRISKRAIRRLKTSSKFYDDLMSQHTSALLKEGAEASNAAQ